MNNATQEALQTIHRVTRGGIQFRCTHDDAPGSLGLYAEFQGEQFYLTLEVASTPTGARVSRSATWSQVAGDQLYTTADQPMPLPLSMAADMAAGRVEEILRGRGL